MGLSCVAVWRGTWLAWDAAHALVTGGGDAQRNPTASGLISHGVAVTALGTSGYISSVLALPSACGLIQDDALRKTKGAAEAGAREARLEFARGATWLFRKTPK
jgi:hypothetical protein